MADGLSAAVFAVCLWEKDNPQPGNHKQNADNT